MENNPNKEFYPYINNELYQKIKDKFSSATKKNPIVISSSFLLLLRKTLLLSLLIKLCVICWRNLLSIKLP